MDCKQGLINIDPERARVDPVIVPDVAFYNAQLKIQAEVDRLQPPPRPANWVVSVPLFVCVHKILICLTSTMPLHAKIIKLTNSYNLH